MKKITILLILISTSLSFGQTPPLNPFFEKYRDDDRFTQVYISGKMLNLIAELDDEDYDDDEERADSENIKSTLQQLDGIWVLSIGDDDESGIKLGKGKGEDALDCRDLYKEAKGMVVAGEYEELMTVRDEGEEFLILIQEKEKIISELVLLGYETEECCDGDSFFMLSLRGKIDLRGISDIGEALDIEELEKLEKLEE